MIVVVPLSIPVLFLFRDTAVVKRLFAWVKQLPKRIWQSVSDPKTMHPGCLILLLSVYSYFLMIVATTNCWDLMETGIRYFYHILPCMVLLVVGLAELLLRKARPFLKKASIVVCVLGMGVLLGYQHIKGAPTFLIKTREDDQKEEITESVTDHDCIVLISRFANIQCLSLLVEDADTILTVRHEGDNLRSQETISEMQTVFDKGEPFYLLVDATFLYPDDYEPEEEEGNTSLLSLENVDTVYRRSFDDLLVEKNVVNYMETISGYSSEYCGITLTQNLNMATYCFKPSEE